MRTTVTKLMRLSIPLAWTFVSLTPAFVVLSAQAIPQTEFTQDFSNSLSQSSKQFEPTTAIGFIMRGRAYRQQGRLEEAIADFQQAIQLDPNSSNAAIAYNQIGLVYIEQRLWSQAATQFQQATSVDPTLAEAYGNLGYALQELGQIQAAQEAYANQERLLRDQCQEAIECINLGRLRSREGRSEDAIEAYLRAISLNPNLSAAYNNLANELRNLGKLEEAVDTYHAAINVIDPNLAIANPSLGSALSLSYNNLGFTLLVLGREAEATEALDRALEFNPSLAVFRTNPETVTAVDYNNRGRALRSQGRQELAIDDYRRAIELDSGFAPAYNNLGVALLEYREKLESSATVERQRLLDEAIAVLQAATEIHPTYAQYFNLGRALRAAGRTEEAVEAYLAIETVLDRVETLPTRVENLSLVDALLYERNFSRYEELSGISAANQDYYVNYIELLMTLHQWGLPGNLNVKALEISERARARGLLEVLAEANICQVEDNTQLAGLIRQECRLRQEFKSLIAQWENLEENPTSNIRDIQSTSSEILEESIPDDSSSFPEDFANPIDSATADSTTEVPVPVIPEGEDEQSRLEFQIRDVLQEYEQVSTQILEIDPDYAQLAKARPLSIESIQQEILDDKTLLLHYWLGEEHSYLWVVSQDSVESYKLPGRSEINETAQAFYDSLTIPSERVKPVHTARAGMRLSQMILEPLGDRLNDQRLIIVADGMLRYIPFSALPHPNADTRELDREPISEIALEDLPEPLLINHEIVNLPSASTLAAIRQRRRQPAPETLAILANPVLIPPLREALSDEPGVSLGESSEIDYSIQFPPLPDTGREAERLLQLADREDFEDSTQLFDRFAVNLSLFRNDTLSRYRLIHFATHGQVDDSDPTKSGLVLSFFNEQGDPVPNTERLLFMDDLFGLTLSADVVVLSSCRTGLGAEVTGEGLVGLSQGFLSAGASSVVVSLWSVNDEATAVLMEQFYQIMLDKLEDDDTPAPADALRRAQLKLWEDERWRNPYFWAGFTVQGEWR